MAKSKLKNFGYFVRLQDQPIYSVKSCYLKLPKMGYSGHKDVWSAIKVGMAYIRKKGGVKYFTVLDNNFNDITPKLNQELVDKMTRQDMKLLEEKTKLKEKLASL